jgi:hypothetical protein
MLLWGLVIISGKSLPNKLNLVVFGLYPMRLLVSHRDSLSNCFSVFSLGLESCLFCNFIASFEKVAVKSEYKEITTNKIELLI